MFDNDKNQLDDFFGLQTDNSQIAEKDTLKETIKKPDWRARLRSLAGALSFGERYTIFALLLVMLGAIIAVPITSYYHFTNAVPAHGGTLREGIVGEPRLINPLLSQNNDADRDLSALIYAGLLRYNNEGKLVPDLAKSYEISADGLSYTIYLKDGLTWHDGKPLTADDVLFTIQTAQNPDYVSPQRINWQGVDVEKVNDQTVIFRLKNIYGQFLNSLTLGIMPHHLWQDIKPINFNLSELNLKPIGAGPYKFKSLKKDKLGKIVSYELESNKTYQAGRPYIDKLEITFYPSENELVGAYNASAIDNLGFVSAKSIGSLKFKRRLSLEAVKLPRYFLILFNQNQSKILSDQKVRSAVNHAINRDELVSKVLSGYGISIYNPLSSEIFGISDESEPIKYDPSLAEKLLTEAGWQNKGQDGILIKKNETSSPKPSPKPKTAPKSSGSLTAGQASPSPSPSQTPVEAGDRLSLKLTTSTWPELVEVATILKEQLAAIGIEVIVETLPISNLQQAIKERSYQMLLFGEILGIDPDPLTLWHSSQKRDPGLNLALYENKSADKLLEEARQTLSPTDRARKYSEFQKLVAQDVPAAFLYSPLYIYGVSRDVHGFDAKIISMPSDRFNDISNWYIQTHRVWK